MSDRWVKNSKWIEFVIHDVRVEDGMYMVRHEGKWVTVCVQDIILSEYYPGLFYIRESALKD